MHKQNYNIKDTFGGEISGVKFRGRSYFQGRNFGEEITFGGEGSFWGEMAAEGHRKIQPKYILHSQRDISSILYSKSNFIHDNFQLKNGNTEIMENDFCQTIKV